MGESSTRWVGHFWKRQEFACHCGCGRDEVHPFLVQLADDVRRHVGVAMSCNSGVRCEEHNREIGGRVSSPASFGSLHLPAGALHQGHAGDFSFFDKSRNNRVNILRLYILFESYGRSYGSALGLGLYSWGVHCDVRGQLGLKAARWEEGFVWPRL